MIFYGLSDDEAFILYNSIALGEGHDLANLIKKMVMSLRQYYLRILRVSKVGLAKRAKGKSKYISTALGNVVYDAVATGGTALDHYWALKAIESFQSSSAAPSHSKENVTKLIGTLIDDHKIKKILNSPLVSRP